MTEVNSLCRLCSTNVNGEGLFIFGEDGKKSLLESKIKLYLHFSVAEDDELPKVLCNVCVRKLNSVHRFATMALCMQDRLRSRLGLHALPHSDVPSTLNLLHSVCNERVAIKQEEVSIDCEVMEMEVDPMSILCPDDENDQCSYNDTENSNGPPELDEENENDYYSCNDTENSDGPPDLDEENENDHCSSDSTEKSKGLQEARRLNSDEENHSRPFINKYQLAEKQKPYVCSYCSRGFVQELSLWNHLWLHRDPRSHSKLLRQKHDQIEKAKGKRTREAEKENPTGKEEDKLRKEQRIQFNKTESELSESFDSGFKEKPKGKTLETDSKSKSNQMADGFENNLCGVCRKSFESKTKLETHLESHYQQKKFGCSFCCRVFWSKATLEQHKRNHKVKHYICKECARVYSTKSSLRQHLVTHSDIRPHKCTMCPKSFKRNQDLKFHLNQHTGLRPYVCPFCPKAFASSGNCFSHRKRMHPEECKQNKVPAQDEEAQL